ncbi:unnamed protein product [Aphanomyces euteiches]|uniref:Tubby C-terminal domain-containing protein n=1 Tax=Aphanomyces euteiches TaxID=100861 RepID=A0A6G0XF46_9STRA|nr:hypothetical protein Ae201684_005464 [Aphanomyces euteiches]KAH9092976.1 hypothetical protein Ae201684P_008642 [Aphanomyces euteiches]KAH9133646.1 hypothetical protein AeRB84_020308 [Aphanomyces euteiches]
MYCSEPVEDGNFLEAHVEDCLFGPLEAPPDVAQRLLKAASTSVPWRARFLRTPLRPQAHTIQCHIRVHRNNLYELFTQNAEIPLCSAVRRSRFGLKDTFSIFPANLNDQVIARLERNFVGSKYTVIDVKNAPLEIGAIQYAATFGNTPRQMKVVIPTVSRTSDDSNNVFGTWRTDCYVSSSHNDSILSQIDTPDAFRVIGLVNKPPVWVDSMQAYCLDFGGRVDVASVKNFVLCPSGDLEKSLMVFGRTSDRQVFVMDFQHPLSPVQAFAIALSSLDRHLVTFD